MNYTTQASLVPVERIIDYSQKLFEAIDAKEQIPFYKDWKFYLSPGYYVAVKVWEYFAEKKADEQRKYELYVKALERQNEIIRRLKDKQALTEEYVRQLEEMNEHLQEAIRKLKQDLGV